MSTLFASLMKEGTRNLKFLEMNGNICMRINLVSELKDSKDDEREYLSLKRE